jgi:hypothetical protein
MSNNQYRILNVTPLESSNKTGLVEGIHTFFICALVLPLIDKEPLNTKEIRYL